ncbi:hypothetical protein LTR85_005123 [Meristemomyces frigidus]|nr:hypothetical protein LTR85_005123 [Meristemomyces frigidus]
MSTFAQSSSFLTTQTSGMTWSFEDLEKDVQEVKKPKETVVPSEDLHSHSRSGHASKGVSAGQKRRSSHTHNHAIQEPAAKKARLEHGVANASTIDPAASQLQRELQAAQRAPQRTTAPPAVLRAQPKTQPPARPPKPTPTPAPTPPVRKAAAPFMIDDDSSEEEDANPAVSNKPATSKPAVSQAAIVHAQKEAQRLESERLRREAAQKKDSSSPSSRGGGGETPMVRVAHETTPVESRTQKVDGGQMSDGSVKNKSKTDVISLGSSTSSSEDGGRRQELKEKGKVDVDVEVDAKAATGRLKGVVDLEVETSRPAAPHLQLSRTPVEKRHMEVDVEVDAKPAIERSRDVVDLGAETPRPKDLPLQPSRKPTEKGTIDVDVEVDTKAVIGRSEGVVDLGAEASRPKNPPPHSLRRSVDEQVPISASRETVKPGLKASIPSIAIRPQLTAPPSAQPIAPRSVTPSVTSSNAESEAERQRKIRLENSRKQFLKMQALVKEQAEAAKRAEEEAKEAERRAAEEEKTKEEEAVGAAEEKKAADVRRQEAFKRQAREKREAEARRVEEVKKEAAVRREAQVKEAEERLRAEAERKAKKEEQEEQFRQRSKLALPPAAAAISTNIFGTTQQDRLAKPQQPPATTSSALTTEVRKVSPRTAKTVEQLVGTAEGRLVGLQTNTVSDAEQARRQRVQAMKERNERNRLAAEAVEDVYAVPEEEQVVVRKGPVSLNSLAGVQRLNAVKQIGARPKQARNDEEEDNRPSFEQMPRQTPPKPAGPMSLNSAAAAGRDIFSHTNLQRRPSTLSTPPARQAQSKYHDPSLGEIMPADIKLMMWRDAGNEWPDIIEDYEEATGLRRSHEWLRKRYRKVKDAVQSAALDHSVIQRVATDDLEAREQLNRAVRGVWPVSKTAKPERVQEEGGRPAAARNVWDATNSTHARSLGEFLPQDIKLVRWKDGGMDWSRIPAAFEQASGLKRHADTLRKRYRQVKDALSTAKIDDYLLDLAETADPQAVARVNKLVARKARGSVDLSKNPHYGQALGKIMPEDAKLVIWRDSGKTFEKVVSLYQAATGVKRHLSSLYGRYRVVKAAIDGADVDQDLLELVADGDDEATQQLNKLVRDTLPASASESGRSIKPPKLKQSLRDQFAGIVTRPGGMGPYDSESSPGLAWPPSEDFGSTTPPTSPEMQQPTSLLTAPQPDRPTTSGKTMNAAVYQYYLEGLSELYAQESDVEEEGEAEEEPVSTPKDFYHFTYQVQRREITSEELEEEVRIDMKEWLDCGNLYTDLGKANGAAPQQVFNAHDPDLNDAIHTSNQRNLSDSRDEDGLAHFTLSLAGGGMVQVRVVRRTRTFQDHVKPSSTISWVDRKHYYVTTRIIIKTLTSDDLFGEAPEPIEKFEFDGSVYTTLELANSRAIERFLDATFHSGSSNLVMRNVERMEAKKALLGELEGEGALFKKSAEDDKAVFEVQVEVGKIAGPRNI